MTFFFRLSPILAVLTLLGCSQHSPSDPLCRQSALLESQAVDQRQNNNDTQAAACLIKTQDKAVLIRHRLSGKLDFPGGGVNEGESLSCAAHRETWEETGFNVLVRKQLGKTSNGLALFACDLDAGIDLLPEHFSPPSWAALEVIAIEKVDPFLLNHKSLRYADDLISLRDGFIAFDTN
ncbi:MULTISPECIES: NUDIX hydrolase [unclassified Alteromonas]|jgi:phosphatase NudJ|uniref:NUDIX hydrolase n=1 Tax=unclassified Alteromonas TaxID=2614992 RepID=UPI0005097CEB|nr:MULTISPECIES: NUDIX hydrolase [unclassified Alteromonas]